MAIGAENNNVGITVKAILKVILVQQSGIHFFFLFLHSLSFNPRSSSVGGTSTDHQHQENMFTPDMSAYPPIFSSFLGFPQHTVLWPENLFPLP